MEGVLSGWSGGRYFNDFEVSDEKVTKKSKDKKKIYSEYRYYQLLPERMKKYMVEPYDFEEARAFSRYSMERIGVADFAKYWITGRVETSDFAELLEKLFEFLKLRPKKVINETEYRRQADVLYIEKVKSRVAKYKRALDEKDLSMIGVKRSSVEDKLEELLSRYLIWYAKMDLGGHESVIGHGDLCFSNMFFDKKEDRLLLIDPRGATSEEELWMNPYYDVAKLSHSILGDYDFFNAGLYDVTLDLKLELKFEDNYEKHRKIFRRYLTENGYDYEKVRLYESGLFLSMLPLHIDDFKKTMGFILNADRILNEVENV